MSEGRGTTRPFELFGAPYVDSEALREELESYSIPGAALRPASFVPTFDKYSGETCRGLQVHITNRAEFQSYRFGIALLVVMHSLYPDEFRWRREEYEFRDDVPALDLLTGVRAVRESIDRGERFEEVWAKANRPHEAYTKWREGCILY